MQTIILINPRGVADINTVPPDELARIPLGLVALATHLKSQGYDVQLVDTRIYDEINYLNRIKQLVRNNNVNNIGITVMTAQIPHALKLSNYVKELDSNIPVVWGGVHPSLFPEQTSLHHMIDFVVIGQGEIPYSKLINRLYEGIDSYDDIKEIAYNGKVNRSQHRPDSIDINKFPFMIFDVLDSLHRYLGPATHYYLSPKKPVKLIETITSRGCPWRCTFCSNIVIPGHGKWRALETERVLEEIEYLIKKYKVQAIRFLDEDFFPDKKRVDEIAEGLIERNIKIIWGANVRANYFKRNYIDEEFAKKLFRSGMRVVSTGAESGSMKILEYIKKDITVEDLLRQAEVCKNAGLKLVLSWMVGFPNETKVDVEETLKLQREISNINKNVIHSATWIFRPYPGGELYDECLKLGLEEPKSLEEWKNIQGIKDQNIGYYSTERLPWIKDVKFLEFVSHYYGVISKPYISSFKNGIKYFATFSLIKLTFKFWKVPLVGYLLFSIYRILRFMYFSIERIKKRQKHYLPNLVWGDAKDKESYD